MCHKVTGSKENLVSPSSPDVVTSGSRKQDGRNPKIKAASELHQPTFCSSSFKYCVISPKEQVVTNCTNKQTNKQTVC